MDWISLKTFVADETGLSRDALHLLTGLGAHLFLVFAFRSWFGALWPVGLIALAALGNEYLDITREPWPGLEERQYWEAAKDMATSLAFPMALLLLARLAPGRLSPPAKADPPSE